MRSIENAEYLVMIGDGATVLCTKHRDSLVLAFVAAGQELDVYEIGSDEEPIACQACHLAAMKDIEGSLQ